MALEAMKFVNAQKRAGGLGGRLQSNIVQWMLFLKSKAAVNNCLEILFNTSGIINQVQLYGHGP